MSKGALNGLKVVEIQGLGPTPFAAMWLADQGAEVVRIQRPNLKPLIPQKVDVLNRGRGFVELDLKDADDRKQAHALISKADMVIEGMRPGVMERLGLGPEDFANAPRLVYGRMTGWGQTGPLAASAGHDINYISLSGALHAIGGAHPAIPLNLVGDFGAGSMFLISGMLAVLYAVNATGKGQVVDAAISDGTAYLMAMQYSMFGSGMWLDEREANLLDGGAPFYTIYECSCGGHMAAGPLEAKFYATFLRLLGIDEAALPNQMDQSQWPVLRATFEQRFREKTRDEWAEIFAGSDACTTPVLSMQEAPEHAHNLARGAFTNLGEVTQPAVAPRLSETPGNPEMGNETTPQNFADVLARWS